MRESVKTYLADLLAVEQQRDNLRERLESRIRANGYRIVTHTCPHGGEDGPWQYLDAATGEVLCEHPNYDSLMRCGDGRFYHADNITWQLSDDLPDPVAPADLSDGLAGLLADWVLQNPEEASELLGEL